MKLHEKLKQIRKRSGMTQAEFAKTLRLSRANYAAIELGKNNATPPLINLIAIKYHVDENQLIDDNADVNLSKLTDRQVVLIESFHNLPESMKQLVEVVIDKLLDYYKDQRK